jgi:hypothetical protein
LGVVGRQSGSYFDGSDLARNPSPPIQQVQQFGIQRVNLHAPLLQFVFAVVHVSSPSEFFSSATLAADGQPESKSRDLLGSRLAELL